MLWVCPHHANTATLLEQLTLLTVPFQPIAAGLYGNLVPQTVSNFCSAIKSGLYTGTLWSKVLPGEYIQAGQQGSRRTGAVDIRAPESVLSRNQEVLSSKSFRLAGQL